ncbi:hypothetical protein [Micromonospora sp. NBRC 101691]|uniref:hypothetical protein n=1 Tax=Micromonospora sp. NBRC 101691 TaxID=3032198 RepID=UPI0024A45A73|nr:hypothetical protein [Micromonospora sp. NBRC 101691]GLY24843.1 hypothetical protein Misp04_45750 [Micromonospora sp. NBRC 101691]
MLLAAGPARSLGAASQSRLRFGEGPKDERAWAGRRLLWLDEQPAFELSHWCGTCPCLFERLEGATSTCSVEDVERRLVDGLSGIDEQVLALFGSLLPRARYLPLLLRIEPRLVRPAQTGDYFAAEQVATWGVNSFWGLPEHPRTPYYRTYESPVDAEAHLYEFVVPMVPPSWNDEERVARYAAELARSANLTAVAVSTLDICAPAVEQGTDYYTHWALTHFLLDGHHKMQAAATAERPVQLLSLLSIDASLASPEEVGRVPALRRAARAPRPAY